MILSVGGPTAIADIGGLRFLTDPTFDPPGEYLSGRHCGSRTVGRLLPPIPWGYMR